MELSTAAVADPGLPGPLAPQDFFKIMQFSSNFEQILSSGPHLGSKLGSPLTKILDPRLSCMSGKAMGMRRMETTQTNFTFGWCAQHYNHCIFYIITFLLTFLELSLKGEQTEFVWNRNLESNQPALLKNYAQSSLVTDLSGMSNELRNKVLRNQGFRV